MSFKAKLRSYITGESVASGYTLAVWGSGALLLSTTNTTPELILSYVAGAVLGFGILALVAFNGFVNKGKLEIESDLDLVLVHLLASLGVVSANYLLIINLEHESKTIWALIGANTTILYNIMLLVEYYISEYFIDINR